VSAPTIDRPVSQGEGEIGRSTFIGQRRVDMALPLALELIDAVRCLDRNRVRQIVDLLDQPAALVILAAMVDQDVPVADLLAWIDGRPTIARRSPRRLTGLTDEARRLHAEFNRCKANDLPISEHVRQGERDYHRLRARQRRAGKGAA
jgi:hypothetical protein